MKSYTRHFGFLFFFALAGCAGGDVIAVASPNGVYKATYSGASNGEIYLEKNASSVSVAINDSAGGSFSGNGTVDSAGKFTVPIQNGMTNASLTGTLSGAGTSATFTAKSTGGLVLSANGTYVGTTNTNAFAGNFNGSYSGSGFGSLSIVVSTTGAISGTASENFVEFPITGSVNNIGRGTFAYTNGLGVVSTFTANFQPKFTLVIGTWTSPNGGSGNFEAFSL